MNNLQKLLALRDRQVITPEQANRIREGLATLTPDDMSDYEIVKKIGDLTPYMKDGAPDESKMIKVHKFLNTGSIIPNPEGNSFLDSDVVVRYKFEGPRNSKNREFCAFMLDNFGTSYFRREDINQMSFSGANNEFGIYSIWLYKGSYNCVHTWSAYLFRPKKSGEGVVVTRSASESSLINDKVIPK